jgi:hypothetical protein
MGLSGWLKPRLAAEVPIFVAGITDVSSGSIQRHP